jgi:uncharacterized membrane protein SirB2
VLEFAQWLQATSLSATIQSTFWIIPTLQSVHILMIGVVFVSIFMVTLRIFERVHMDETLEAVWKRYSPWLWSGLAVMVVTGLLLVIGEPARQFLALSFWLKMGLLAAGVASAAAFGRSIVPATLAAGPEGTATPGIKAGAAATLVLWLAIIFLGRAIAYDFEVWGSLSPMA